MTTDDHDTTGFEHAECDLRRALTPPPLGPAARARLLRAAAPALRENRPRRRFAIAPAFAAAAALLLAAGLWIFLARPNATSPANSQPVANDINADGILDILDAHALALAIDRGQGLDLDADGARTRRDADWLADRVVRIGGPG